jgi:Protein of unknown function (DUF2934)
MSANGYQVAFDRAVNEIGEIKAHLEKLTRRKELLEKLVDLLKDVEAQENVTNFAAAAHKAQHEYANSEAGSAGNESEAPASGDGRSYSQDQVAQLAHHFWSERGNGHGSHQQDWLRAEEKLRTEY